jgi:hypothetical protein
MIQGHMYATFCGKGFFAFLFEKKEYRDLIFVVVHISWEK